METIRMTEKELNKKKTIKLTQYEINILTGAIGHIQYDEVDVRTAVSTDDKKFYQKQIEFYEQLIKKLNK